MTVATQGSDPSVTRGETRTLPSGDAMRDLTLASFRTAPASITVTTSDEPACQRETPRSTETWSGSFAARNTALPTGTAKLKGVSPERSAGDAPPGRSRRLTVVAFCSRVAVTTAEPRRPISLSPVGMAMRSGRPTKPIAPVLRSPKSLDRWNQIQTAMAARNKTTATEYHGCDLASLAGYSTGSTAAFTDPTAMRSPTRRLASACRRVILESYRFHLTRNRFMSRAPSPGKTSYRSAWVLHWLPGAPNAPRICVSVPVNFAVTPAPSATPAVPPTMIFPSGVFPPNPEACQPPPASAPKPTLPKTPVSVPGLSEGGAATSNLSTYYPVNHDRGTGRRRSRRLGELNALLRARAREGVARTPTCSQPLGRQRRLGETDHPQRRVGTALNVGRPEEGPPEEDLDAFGRDLGTVWAKHLQRVECN